MTTSCSVKLCGTPTSAKSARGMCMRHYVDMALTRADGLNCPSVDHITPRSLGGTHDPTNLQLAHLACNMRKNNRMEEVTV